MARAPDEDVEQRVAALRSNRHWVDAVVGGILVQYRRGETRLHDALGPAQLGRKRLRHELVRVQQGIRCIVDAIADGAPARALKDELLALEARPETLRTELTDAPEPAPLIYPNLAEVYRRKVAALQEALESDETRAEAFEAIRSLIEAIVLTPEGGALKIDLRGDVAHILALSSESGKPAAISGGLVEQIKLVAGARNWLYLQFVTSMPSKSTG